MELILDICVPQTREVNKLGEGATTYVVSLPRLLQSVKCPVPGCPAIAHSAGRLRESFMYRHVCSQVSVVQEEAEPLP